MAWNSAVDGDWTQADFSKAPWTAGVMTLTHEEVLHVIDACVPFVEVNPSDDFYIVSEYNKLDWETCINGDTYGVIKSYNPEVNTLGIDSEGIVAEPVEEPVEDVEAPVEEV